MLAMQHSCVKQLSMLTEELELGCAGGVVPAMSACKPSQISVVQQLEDFISELTIAVAANATGECGEQKKHKRQQENEKRTSSRRPESESEAASSTGGAAIGRETEAHRDRPELDPSKLDIRVGIVTKCWPHPDSEKLYCEVGSA